MSKNQLDEVIEQKKQLFVQTSDTIWQYAELRFAETQSADLLCDILTREGFTVKKGIAGLATAFVASFGAGSPVVAILGEYDALSGLSQQKNITRREPVAPGQNGHGCGHNLLGVGSLAAAIAVKQYLSDNKLSGTIRYYGCPGEEGGSGKTFMAREGAFDGAEVAITWHPMTHNTVFSMSTLANVQATFKFHGKSSHAGTAPHLGRSALDAVELMNVGVNYLREHIVQEARVHYAITNAGGNSPNVVQPEAEVLYLIRAPKVDQVQDIYERVCKIAQGAAMMTETQCEIIFDKACSNYIPNRVLGELLLENFIEVGAPRPDAEEMQFACSIQNTLTEQERNSDLQMAADFIGEERKDLLQTLRQSVLSDLILPSVCSPKLLSGSTDVGDVSWILPTAQLCVACNVFGTPGHSWQTVVQSATPFAHKGMLTAGKVMARTIINLMERPALVAEAQAELQDSLAGSRYVCPIPAGVMPKLAQ